MNRLIFASVLVVAALLVSATAPIALGASPSGAIFTTTAAGVIVNENHFYSKCAVYLDGGPGPNAPADAAGLPDGEYYFQVTDPSGKNLLSTDPVSNRKFRVENGVIVAYTGSGSPSIHPTGIDQDHPELGAITIRLANLNCPDDLEDTTNNGGVYKVWATPVEDFEGNENDVDSVCGGGCYHGFLPQKSKTDNFKVTDQTPTFCLTVGKKLVFAPLDSEGQPGEGWEFEVTDYPLEFVNTRTTDEHGLFYMCGLTEGDYKIKEVEQEGYTFSYLTDNGEVKLKDLPPLYWFRWAAGDPDPVIVFHNIEGVGPPPPPQ